MMPQKPDIILISYYFPPCPDIGGARPYRFYKYLRKAGRRCYVVTAAEQAADAPPDVFFVPDRTARLWQAEGAKPSLLNAPLDLMARRFLLPGDTGITWSIAAARRCRAIIAAAPERSFVAVSSYPPVGPLLAGLWMAFPERVPWISDFRDPLGSREPRRFSLAAPAAAGLRDIAFRAAGVIIANTEPMAAAWRDAFPEAKSRIRVIWNGFDPEVRPQARQIPARPYRLLAHAGTLYGGRSPALIMQSLARLRETVPETRDARLLLVGPVEDGAGLDEELCDSAARQGWLDLRNCMLPKSEAGRLIEEADFLLLLQPQSAVQVPGKLFEYLSIGRPIVALAPRRSAVENILENAGVPYVCIYPDEEPEARDRKLFQILQLPSRPTRFSTWFEKHFDARRQTEELLSLIDGMSVG